MTPWPASPPATAEQGELALDGTAAARYARWRRTRDGQVALAWMARRALEEIAAGATRLSAKELTEACRWHLHLRINNVHTPHIARELQEAYPALRGRFEMRQRTAA